MTIRDKVDTACGDRAAAQIPQTIADHPQRSKTIKPEEIVSTA
jgi:hypothetical protein